MPFRRFLSHVKFPWSASNGMTFSASGQPDPTPLAHETEGYVTDSEGIAWIWNSELDRWIPQSPIVYFLDDFPHDTSPRLANSTWYYKASLGPIPFVANVDVTWQFSIKRLTTGTNGLQEWYPLLSVSRDGVTWSNVDETTVRVRPWAGTTTEQRPVTLIGAWGGMQPATDFHVRLRAFAGGGPASANYLNGKLYVVVRPAVYDVESTASGPG